MKLLVQDPGIIFIGLLGATICFVQAYFLAIKQDFRMISMINEETRRRLNNKEKLGRRLGIQTLIAGMGFLIMPLAYKMGPSGLGFILIIYAVWIVDLYIVMFRLDKNIKKGKY